MLSKKTAEDNAFKKTHFSLKYWTHGNSRIKKTLSFIYCYFFLPSFKKIPESKKNIDPPEIFGKTIWGVNLDSEICIIFYVDTRKW